MVQGRRRQWLQAAWCPGNAQEHKYPAVWAAARTTSRTRLHSSRLLIDEFNLYAKRQGSVGLQPRPLADCRRSAPPSPSSPLCRLRLPAGALARQRERGNAEECRWSVVVQRDTCGRPAYSKAPLSSSSDWKLAFCVRLRHSAPAECV